ncbi:MAG: serine/threonine protein kinase [Pirellulales bacterium]
MTFEPTQRQSSDELDEARARSLSNAPAPSTIPGYDLLERLGTGAFGEVWTARDQNTGVVVAVKFYASRGSVDWAPVYREVEKLVLLSQDSHVVKLLQVGWTSDPPYYVMDHMPGGSLAQRLAHSGPLPRAEAAALFRELLVGMQRAHGRGVLHCDLKPENVLLDADQRPRLADFGQSRRVDDATPALGTFFYMAPEQADSAAAPDARWDVYALGAILHCLLVGEPPHRTPELLAALRDARGLEARLREYRERVSGAGPVAPRLRRQGIDRRLAAIVERCLDPRPATRYQSVAEILAGLDDRALQRARRPLWLLGAGGPVLLLLILSFFAWRGYQRAVRDTIELAQRRAVENNRFAAELAAERATSEIADQFATVEYEAERQRLAEILLPVMKLPSLVQLNDPQTPVENLSAIRQHLRADAERKALDEYLVYRLSLYAEDAQVGIGPRFASLFVVDAHGTMIGAAFDPKPLAPPPIGDNFAHRAYFHGGPAEPEPAVRPPLDVQSISRTYWSPVFQSSVTDERKVAISTPIRAEVDGREQFVGVLVITVRQEDLRLFREPATASAEHFLVLVDDRPGERRGTILVHPLLKQLLLSEDAAETDSLRDYQLAPAVLDAELGDDSLNTYHDPFGNHPAGAAWNKPWLAAAAPVTMPAADSNDDAPIRDSTSGLVVLVQEDLTAITAPVRALAYQLLREGILALALVSLVTPLWWLFVWRITTGRERRRTTRP